MNRMVKSVFWVEAVMLLLSVSTLHAEPESSVAVALQGEEFPLEPLRDPFWPIGYYPPQWEAESSSTEEVPPALPSSSWDIPTTMIRVSGTSRMGDQTAAIINGEVKSIGDLIEIRYEGQIYRWKLKDVKPSGKVSLERHTVTAASGADQSGE